MNIAFYTEQEITPYTGGIGRVTSILTDNFRNKYGWRVYSLYADTVHASSSKMPVDGRCQGRLHDRFNFRCRIKKNTLAAAKFIKENRVDVVIVQTSMDVPMRLRRALQHICYDTKIITCLHFAPGKDIFLNKLGDIRETSFFSTKGVKIILKAVFSVVYNPLITYLTKLCYRRAYQYSDLVCLLSESYKDTYCRFSGVIEQEKLIVIPNPLSFQAGYTASKLEEKKSIVLVVGRMSEFQKRISIILSVWNKYEKQHPASNWQLKVVGGGSSLENYQRQAQAYGLKKCSFEGVQNPIPYYQESKLFLMTSAFEGFPMTLVEAQQFGCVPIAMNAFTSLPEIISDGRNGIIIENHNEKQLLSALEDLTTDTAKWHELAVNALIDCQRYSQATVCMKWKNLIERIVK